MQKHKAKVWIHLNTCGENFMHAMSKEDLLENNASILFSDERLDWLQNDDYGKWPGRQQCLSQHRAPLLSSNGTAISANAFQTYCWHIGWKVHIFSSSLSLAPLTAVLRTTPFKHIYSNRPGLPHSSLPSDWQLQVQRHMLITLAETDMDQTIQTHSVIMNRAVIVVMGRL